MFMKIMGSTLLIIFALLTGCKNSPLHEQNLAMKETLSMNPIKKSGVQVVGVIWLNPLHRKDYPTEWQTLWVMGIAKPNADDDMLRKKPFNYSTVKYVSLIADGNAGQTSKLNYHRGYQYELIGLLHDNYYGDPDYFYNVTTSKEKNIGVNSLAYALNMHYRARTSTPRQQAKRRSRFFKTPSPWVIQVVQPSGPAPSPLKSKSPPAAPTPVSRP